MINETGRSLAKCGVNVQYHTITEKLENERQGLEKRLEEIKKVQEILNAQPEVQKCLDALTKLDMRL